MLWWCMRMPFCSCYAFAVAHSGTLWGLGASNDWTRLERFFGISVIYAAWLYYKRLPFIVTNAIESPSMITCACPPCHFSEVVNIFEFNEKLRASRQWVDSPGIVAAVITPPVLQLLRSKRNHSFSPNPGREGKTRNTGGSPSKESKHRRGNKAATAVEV